jgi:beta-carotene/zeaxanthin 4-ketolase
MNATEYHTSPYKEKVSESKRYNQNIKTFGVPIAALIILSWCLVLYYLLNSSISFSSPFFIISILVQTHLFTGLFITAHDAMHGVVSLNKKVNYWIGFISALLFAFNYYKRLLPKHHDHHNYVATTKDPDYHKGGFLIWYFSFLKQYVTIWQIIMMAVTYNVMILIFPMENVIAFWIIPSLLATMQLFFFGTYLPHKGNHSEANIHKSRSLKKNHLIAFLTCYFFGYHYEHHDAPWVPWWLLYREKA